MLIIMNLNLVKFIKLKLKIKLKQKFINELDYI